MPLTFQKGGSASSSKCVIETKVEKSVKKKRGPFSKRRRGGGGGDSERNELLISKAENGKLSFSKGGPVKVQHHPPSLRFILPSP